MRAAYYREQGAATKVLRIGAQPTPEAGEGEVRVRLRTSGVNPSDIKSRVGFLGRPMVFPLVIPHSDGAGDIDSVGAGVSTSRVGERVWVWNGQYQRPFGTAAEYIVVPARQAVELPAGIDYAEGACLGIPALTAFQALRLAGVNPGGTLLVTGGAGAVGHYAVQLAKLRGLRVFTTISSDAKAAHAKQAGADHMINYTTEDVGAQVKELTNGRGVDAVIDLDIVANAHLIPKIMNPHGTVVVYGYGTTPASLPVQWLVQNSATLRFFLVYDLTADDRAIIINELTDLMLRGQLVHAVARRWPLDEIADAHLAIESGSCLGNVVVDIR
jgi:NADPH:quinone reductase